MMDQTCEIAIHNVHGWQLDSAMRGCVLAFLNTAHPLQSGLPTRAILDHGPVRVDVYPQTEGRLGWLQWHIRVHFGPLTDTYRFTRHETGHTDIEIRRVLVGV